MGTRIHLYAVPGLPLHVDDLMPQTLLARCAGGLAAHGHLPRIIDMGSVERLAGGETAEYREERSRAHSARAGWRASLGGRRRREARAAARFRAARGARIVQQLDAGAAPALSVIQIRRRKDVQDARLLGQLLRARHPRMCIAVAGHFVNTYARALLAGAPEFDVACVGPAESVLAGLARSLDNRPGWEHIPGLVFRLGSRLAVGSLGLRPLTPDIAPANYHPSVYPGLLDGGKIRLFTLPQSTGFSHTAHYHGDTAQQPVHVRDARQLRSEMMLLHEMYGARAFHFSGAGTPRDAIAQLAAECLSLPFEAVYSRDGHVCELDADLAAGLAQSGCQSLGLYLVTGSQRLLTDFYGEDWTISQAESALRACKAEPMHVHTSFTFPCPADDYHSRAETFRILRRCQPNSASFELPELRPGSAWRQHAPEFGFGLAERKLARWIAAPLLANSLAEEAADLPFTLGRLDKGSAPGKVGEAHHELSELGIARSPGAAAGLMARVADWEAPYPAALENALLDLDLEHLHEVIERFNARATASINAVDLFGGVAVRKAVGD